MQFALDHLVVTADDLEAGAAWTEARLGTALSQGGRHPAMATHNRLVSLGPAAYLEVIAPDPTQPPPRQPRWFALDARPPGPALTHWAVRVDDLDAALAWAPDGAGVVWPLARGDFRWRMGVPRTGQTPFDGLFPALLEWQSDHPAPRLPDRGLRLLSLRLAHPDASALTAALGPLLADPRLGVAEGPRGIAAEILTPAGPVTL